MEVAVDLPDFEVRFDGAEEDGEVEEEIDYSANRDTYNAPDDNYSDSDGYDSMSDGYDHGLEHYDD